MIGIVCAFFHTEGKGFYSIVRGNRVELQKKLKKMWDFSTEVGLAYDVIVSPTVIPYDEFEQYKEKLPYYRNIVKEGRKIG